MRLRSVLALPTLLWFFLFILIPMIIVMVVSFAWRGAYGGIIWEWTHENYSLALSSVYLGIFLRSVQMALLTTLTCLVLGVPVTWAIATADSRMRRILILALALPFLTNLVIRLYAVRSFLGFEGPLQTALTWMGIPFDPFAISQNHFLVYYGMVTTYLPFMVMPLYAAFEKFDFALVEVAQDLGAKPWKVLTSVILPNMKDATWNGSLLVFIPSLGECIIPDLLGGAKSMLYANLIIEQFLKARNWPLGSALAVILMFALMLAAVAVWKREGRKP